MPTLQLYFATSNTHKVRETENYLGLEIKSAPLELTEPQTLDMEELARHKALEAWDKLGRPVMVEDTALVFHGWKGLPGPFIRFFIENMGLEGLYKALEGFPDKSAEAICTIGYHDGHRVSCFHGHVKGHICPPRGEQGFGWDPIFVPEGSELSFAEMSLDQKQRFSMRAQALEKFSQHLDLLGG
ncbi:MAG: RdgB/HAM1 family non-canonical purine NTP pyrophosphatase [Deltaproteobacteria bacterium]|nr:RdgB/HAM1 family non-canonical purine NTP pyrophosphatase [Deltaproteobacteria bacterium]